MIAPTDDEVDAAIRRAVAAAPAVALEDARDELIQTLRDALELVWSIHVRDNVHLGWERRSGIQKDCIACIAAIALGRGMGEAEPGEFRERLTQIAAYRAAIANGEGKR